MPFYRYVCEKCGSEKRIFHGMNEDPTVLCDCGSGMKRTVSKVAVVFKGSGFYITDNRKSETKKEEKSEEAA
ncbi:FmdB family zinc ribbon protein [Pseudothermotoga sp.]|uniref:FmdB family zinc ribbon protein n=1 Tax=Pseudothermotoga sp. TaxID=2033661 RepID=UPI00299A573C|nr:FmdB family transcriptional regulator [Pseudothermotoga sp.]MCX7813589.1 FmdB family transcriptional regulator [Pseudothermotoga sp.]MDW8140007.1 FmdB family zinc ribbon protein [Pseudothermotoga sp.]